MKLNGSQIVLEVLKEQGVDTIFGYPGGTILNIFDQVAVRTEAHFHAYFDCSRAGCVTRS